MRSITLLAVLGAATVLITGCGGNSSNATGSGTVKSGGTFTMALNSDPGNLDPLSNAGSALFEISQLAYDRLLAVDPKSGAVRPALASAWKADGTAVTLTLKPGITCSDGSPLTASDVAANLTYLSDPKNKSPFLGVFYPAGATAKGDDQAGTVSIELAANSPFVLAGLANLPIVCRAGLDDRKSLAATSSGTGPYQLTQAVPGSQYTYKIRDGYTWGPDGASTAVKGMPDTIVMKIVQNASTAANLLLSGGLNAAHIGGPDAARLDAAKLFSASTPHLIGEQWYNQGKGHQTADPAVRKALTQALDLPQLAQVLTAGHGGPATTLAVSQPAACPGDSVSGNLPAHDPAAAKAALASAGISRLTFLYDNTGGSASAAAAELAVQQWKAAGIDVQAKAQNGTAIQQTIFGSGDWDIAWIPLNVNAPDQLVPFLSGPASPNGTNFAGIHNPDYEAGVAKAAALSGSDSCSAYLAAESALVSAADVVPFGNEDTKTYGAGAEFATPGQLAPTSIRMLAK
jgi:peptide/nickel transport system substrate-binding protein